MSTLPIELEGALMRGQSAGAVRNATYRGLPAPVYCEGGGVQCLFEACGILYDPTVTLQAAGLQLGSRRLIEPYI